MKSILMSLAIVMTCQSSMAGVLSDETDSGAKVISVNITKSVIQVITTNGGTLLYKDDLQKLGFTGGELVQILLKKDSFVAISRDDKGFPVSIRITAEQ